MTKNANGPKNAAKAVKAVKVGPAKAPRKVRAAKAEPAAPVPAPDPEKAPKVKRLELTTRQREVLREDATDSGLKADVEKGKQVTMTAGVMKDLGEFAARGEDATRQRVYQGLLARAEVFVKEHGLAK